MHDDFGANSKEKGYSMLQRVYKLFFQIVMTPLSTLQVFTDIEVKCGH